MHVDDIFAHQDENDRLAALDTDLLEAAIRGAVPSHSDTNLASALIDLLHQELEAFATDRSNRIPESESQDFRLLVHACRQVTRRLGLDFPDLPFRDMPSFRDYWIEQEMSGSGSWAMRRNYLHSLFGELHAAIDDLQYQEWEGTLFQPITPHSATGWAVIDSEITQLRDKFSIAKTDQDHSAIGNSCVRILELLGDVAFDPARYLEPGEPLPPRGNTKDRFDKIIDCKLHGSDNQSLRTYARKLVELAQVVKHRATPNRRDAGIAADGVIALANMIRRITLD